MQPHGQTFVWKFFWQDHGPGRNCGDSPAVFLCPSGMPVWLPPGLASREKLCPQEEAERLSQGNPHVESVKLLNLSKKNSSDSFWFFFCFDNDLITTSFDQKHKLFLCASYFENTLLAFIICLWSLKIYFVSFSQTNPSAFWQGWASYLQCSCCVKQCLGEKITWGPLGVFIHSLQMQEGLNTLGDTEWMSWTGFSPPGSSGDRQRVKKHRHTQTDVMLCCVKQYQKESALWRSKETVFQTGTACSKALGLE